MLDRLLNVGYTINQHKLEKKHWPTCWMSNKFTPKSEERKESPAKQFNALGSKHQVKMSCFSF